MSHEFWTNWFMRRVNELSEGKPGLAVMGEVLKEWSAEPYFRGCAFINTVAENCDYTSEETRIAQSHNQGLCSFIQTLIPSQSPDQAERIARLAVLVIDGAIVRAQMTQDPTVAYEAKALLAQAG